MIGQGILLGLHYLGSKCCVIGAIGYGIVEFKTCPLTFCNSKNSDPCLYEKWDAVVHS